MGDNSEKKKNTSQLFYIKNTYVKFQDSIFNGSQVTVGIKNRDGRKKRPTQHKCIKCERLGLKEEKTKLKEVYISKSSAYHSSCRLVSDNGVFKGWFTNGTREV